MSLRINHNIASINGHRNMMKNDMAISKSLEKLSSGLRINRAADDAAGLVISEQMRAQITGLNQAIDNSETAISMVQTAEGALDEVNSLLNKARELVLHAANEGANDTNQLAADQAELDNVISSITRIGDFTQFGTKKLLDGSLDGVAKDSAGNNIADTGINRIKVGNLANNAAVSSTSMSLNVTALVKEATLMTGTVANDAGVVFSAAVTGLDLTGGQKLRSGATATLTISGVGSYTITGATGGSAAATIASGLNSAVGTGYIVTYDTTSKGFKVESAGYGGTDINSSMSFFIAGNGGGTTEAVKASIGLAAGATGTASAAAGALLATGGSNLSGLSTSTVLDSGTVFDLTVTTSTGAFTATYTTSSADTIADVVADLQADLQGDGIIGANATIAFADDSAGGFSLSVARSGAAVAADLNDFDVSVTIDNPNAAGGSIEAYSVAVSNATLSGTGGIYNTGAALSGNTVVNNGVGFYLEMNGVQVQHITAGGEDLAAVAAALELALSGAGFAGFRVDAVTGGADLTGLVAATGNGATGVTLGAGMSFAVYTTGVGSDQVSSLALHIDSAALTGLDFSGTVTNSVTGAAVDATLNLVSTATARTSGVVVIADTTIATNTTSVTSGTSNPTVSLNYGAATGLTLAVSKTLADGSLALSLATGVSANDGFENIEIEITEAVAQAGGSYSFTIDDGALFQVGANGGQNVGVTIEAVNAVELGRNVDGSGVLESLDDLSSSNKGALLNGLTDEALAVIDDAIDEVTVLRGDLGAFQANTLETGLNSLRVSQENLTAAESTIRDVDFAAESAMFTRNNIMIQASTAMLAQANQLPQNVLQLLG